jgi:hypothetical protein
LTIKGRNVDAAADGLDAEGADEGHDAAASAEPPCNINA